MTVTDLFSPARPRRERAPTDRRRWARTGARRRALPGVERLEGLLLLSGLATQQLSTAPQTVSVSSVGNAYPVTQALPAVINQFNPILGTLDAVEIQLGGSLSSQVQVTNGNPNLSTTVVVNLAGSVALSGPLIGAGLTAPLPLTTVTSPTLAPNQTYLFPHPVGTSGTNSETLTDPALLAGFIGTGAISPATAVTNASSTANSPDPNFAGVTGQFLTSSQATVTVTYEYTPPAPGAVSGFVYNDLNNSGLKDTGEPGFAGQTVVLSGTDYLGQAIAPETTTTDSQGFYSFGTVPVGTYTVTETTEPAGFLRNKDSLNGVVLPIGATDSIPGIAVTAGNTAPNNDFGKLAPAAVSGFVYKDLNNNGLKETGEAGFGGQSVVLSGTNDLGQSVTQTLVTNASQGFYNFTGLRPGTYTVTETTEPGGYLRGKDSRNGVVLPIGAVDQVPGIAVAAGATAPNNDFGKLPPGTVSGFVYGDVNGNGLKNIGEPGYGHVTVALTGTNDLGQPVARETTLTGISGAYSFTGLRPGSYTVTETTVPAGLRPFKNSRNGVVLPYNKNSDTVPGIAVPVGATAPNNNFGLIANPPGGNGPSSLSGYVFDDTKNDNGIKNPGEPGLANVAVTITGTDELGDHVTMTTHTNTSGFYQFSGLFAGTYRLTEGASPANFHHGLTSINNVVVAGSNGTGLIPAVPLADQQVRLNNDFAELRNSSPQTPCGPLFLTNIQRFGLHNEPTELVLTFNEAVDSATALNPANYVLRNTVNFVPEGPAVGYRAIVYNATAHTVTLIPNAPINVHDQYLLSVNGIKSVCDNYTLQGTSGIQGTPYTVTVNRSQLSGFLTNQGVFIPVDHGQFAPGTFGLVPPVGGASAGALAGYPIALSGLPAQVNGKPSLVMIGSNPTTTPATKTVKVATAKAATPVAQVVTVGKATPRPFSIG